MLVGFGNIARLPSTCMPLSLHDSPVSFSLVEVAASSCHYLSSVCPHLEDKTFRRVIFLTATCRFSVSSDLRYQAARRSPVKPLPFA